MKTLINLEAIPASQLEPKAIICTEKTGKKVATIFCDGEIKFESQSLAHEELRQIMIVSENFSLFFCNISLKK